MKEREYLLVTALENVRRACDCLRAVILGGVDEKAELLYDRAVGATVRLNNWLDKQAQGIVGGDDE